MNLNAESEKNKTAKFEFGTVPLGAYVWQIAQNKANEVLEKKIKRANREQIVDPTEGFSPLTQATATQDFDMRLLFGNQDLVGRLLATLKLEKPKYEKLIRRRFYDEMSYRTIANIPETDENGEPNEKFTGYETEESCKSHTSRAVKKLLEYAHGEGVFHYD